MRGKRVGIAEAGNAFEQLGSFKKGLLRRSGLHNDARIVINRTLTVRFVALVYNVYISAQLRIQRFIAEAENFQVILVFVKRLRAVAQLPALLNLQLRHQLAQIRLCVFRVYIQHLFAVGVGVGPFAVLKEKKRPFQKRRGARAARGCRRGRLCGGFLPVGGYYLSYASYKVLHKAQLAHILRLKVGEFLGQVVGVHVLIGGNKHFFGAVFNKRKVAAPFVFYPYGVEVFRPCAQYHHDLCAVKGGKYVRLVGGAQLVLQRNAAEKHLKALLRQLMVKVICQHAVGRSCTAAVGFLIADKYIKGLLLLRNCKNALLYFIYCLGLGLVNFFLGGIGAAQSGFVVIIVKDGGKLRPVHRGNALAGGRVLHIFNTVAAKHKGPIGLGVGVVLGQNLLIYAHGLVVFVIAAEMICPVIQVCLFIAVKTGKGLLGAAAVAHGNCVAGVKFQCPAAHFALKKRHTLSPLAI